MFKAGAAAPLRSRRQAGALTCGALTSGNGIARASAARDRRRLHLQGLVLEAVLGPVEVVQVEVVLPREVLLRTLERAERRARAVAVDQHEPRAGVGLGAPRVAAGALRERPVQVARVAVVDDVVGQAVAGEEDRELVLRELHAQLAALEARVVRRLARGRRRERRLDLAEPRVGRG